MKLPLTLRLSLIVLPLLSLTLHSAPPAVYEPIPEQPFWLEADVRQQFPTEPIIRSTDYVKSGSTFYVSPGEQTQAAIAWIEAEGQWLEPRPAAPTAQKDNMVLSSQSAALEIVGPDGKNIDTSTAGTVIPQGSTVTTKDGWAAITLAGINTLHLMPGATATLNMRNEAGKLNTTVNLKSGGAFSKVGKSEGLPQNYRVQTPMGVAAARGTDFVTLALPTRIEVWIAEGVVDVFDPQGQKVGEVAAADDKALKVLRSPAITDPTENALANASIMTAAFGFVGQANTTTQGIQKKISAGLSPTPEELAFQKETIPVKFLIKVQKKP
jgi:hypothetical protein